MKKLTAIILTLIMALSVLTVEISAMISSAADPEMSENLAALLDKDAPDSFDENSENPLGERKDGNFLLAEENELLFYVSRDGNTNCYVYDDYKMDYTESKNRISNINNATTGNGNGPAEINIGSSSLRAKRMNYVQAIGFDPMGSGRKDHVAYVGLSNYESSGWKYDVTVIVQNTKNGSEYEINLGSADWMKTAGLDQYQGAAYFSITAGDYDYDGKDTIVVACPLSAGSAIKEVSCNLSGGTVSSLSVKNDSVLNIAYEGGVRRDIVNKYLSGKHPQHVTMSLATGDFNGDKVDELAVVTGTRAGDKADVGDSLGIDAIATSLTPMQYRNGTWNIMGSTRYIWEMGEDVVENLYNYSGYDCVAMLQGSVTAGDVNNDGLDEIICVGYSAKFRRYVSSSDSEPVLSQYKSMSKNNYAAEVFNYTGDNTFAGNGIENVGISEFVECNLDRDRAVEPTIQLATAYTNGKCNKKEVFIDGIIYSCSSGGFTASCEPTISGQSFTTNMDGSTECNVTYIGQVASGNFNGNTAGREQFVYTLMFKQRSGNDYHCYIAICGGAKFNDVKNNETGNTEYGELLKYGWSDSRKGSGTFWDNAGDNENASQVFSGKGGSWFASGSGDKYLNAVLVSVDNDEDGIKGRYSKCDWTYSDPDVIAVLQGAPYFGDLEALGAYDDIGETCYGVTVSYERGNSFEKSFSIGAGACVEWEVGTAVKWKGSFEIGYTHDWSRGWENSFSTSWTSEFAVSEDSVVITQIPVTLYSYDLYSQETGNYIEDAYVMTVPGEPEYLILSIDEYNDLADEYKAYLEARAGSDETLNLLVNITPDDLPDAQGNPYKYWSKNTMGTKIENILSKNSYALGHSGGSTTSSYECETGHTVSESYSHGLHVGTEHKFGPEEVAGGVYFEFDFSKNYGKYTANGNGTSISGTVQNPSATDSVPKDVLDQYNFRWQLASWERELTTATDNKTTFFGYSVTDVRSPVSNPDNLTVTYNKNEDDPENSSASLTWTAPNTLPGGPAVSGYNIYVDGNLWNSAPVAGLTAEVSPIDATKSHKITVAAVSEGSGITGPSSNEVTIDKSEPDKIVESIEKDTGYTSEDNLTDRYVITMIDGTTAYFYVTNGKDGENGTGIADAEITNDGTLVITLTDGTPITLGKVTGNDGQTGPQGQPGADGKTPKFEIGEDGCWNVSYDGGTTWTSLGVKAQGDKGETGSAGSAGEPGADGNTPKIEIGEDGCWNVSYDNGTTWTSLGVKAKGDKGEAGKDATITGVYLNDEGEVIFKLSTGIELNAGKLNQTGQNQNQPQQEETSFFRRIINFFKALFDKISVLFK